MRAVVMKKKPRRVLNLTLLIRRTRAGDRAAREALFRCLREALKEKARGHAGRLRGMDASDLTNGALENLLAHFDDFRGSGSGELWRYACRILENHAHQVLRAAGRQKRDQGATVSLEEVASQVLGEGDGLSEQVRRKRMQQRALGALLTLPAAQRQALWLWHNGYKVVEIAQEMERTDKAVASLLERAVRAARQEVGEGLDEDSPQMAAFLCYLYSLERGEAPDREEFLTRYQDRGPRLRALLEGLDWLEEQLRQEDPTT
jgi:RNA polymerase sigma factor (sigma-70 family)